jgi:hypothetical protein
MVLKAAEKPVQRVSERRVTGIQPMAFHLPFYSHPRRGAEPTHILGPDQPNDEQKAKVLILSQMEFSFYLAGDTILKVPPRRLS